MCAVDIKLRKSRGLPVDRPVAFSRSRMSLFIALVYPCCLFVSSQFLFSADKEKADQNEPKGTAEEIFESLLEAFEKEKTFEEYLRVETVRKFGTAPCEKTVEFLTALFEEEPNLGMRAAMFHALGQIGDASAVETIVNVCVPHCIEEYLGGGEEGQQQGLSQFQFLMGEMQAALSRPLGADAESWLVKHGLSGTVRNNEQAKEAVLKVIVRLQTKERGRLLLRELVATSSPELQALLLESLRPLADKKSTSAARRFIKSQDSAVRVAAYELLGQYRPKKNGKKFVSGMKDPHWEVRAVCLEMLAKTSDKQLLKHAKKALGDPDWHVQVAAVHFLVKRGGPAVIEPLYRALDTTEGRAQGDITDALARLTGRNFGPISAQWDSWWFQNKKKKDLKLTAMSAEDFAALQDVDRDQPTVSWPLYFGLRVFSENLAFVVDCSESMEEPHTPKKSATTVVAGQKKGPSRLEVAKRELSGAVRGLLDGKHMNILCFNTNVVDFVTASSSSRKRILTKLGPETRKPINTFIEAAKPVGATNLSAAIRQAFEYPEVDTIFLLSDGAPTVGIIDHQELLDTVERWNRRRRVRINSISFSATPAEKRLLRALSDRNFGVYVER